RFSRDWSSDVCSSDLDRRLPLVDEGAGEGDGEPLAVAVDDLRLEPFDAAAPGADEAHDLDRRAVGVEGAHVRTEHVPRGPTVDRSEERRVGKGRGGPG